MPFVSLIQIRIQNTKVGRNIVKRMMQLIAYGVIIYEIPCWRT